MDWLTVLSNVATFAVVSGILAWLIRKLFGIYIAKDLESFKVQLRTTHDREIERLRADLRVASFEHETRFAKLHEKRVEIMAELYGRLAQLNLLMNRLVNPLHPLTEALEKEVGESGNAFREYYLKNRIYFNEHVCKQLDSINGKFWSAWVDYHRSLSKGLDAKQSYEYLSKSFTTINQEVPPVLKEIEGVFRELLEPREKETD
jgi:hypothetical protein